MEGADIKALEFTGDPWTCRVADDTGRCQSIDHPLTFRRAATDHAPLSHVTRDEAPVISTCVTAF